MLRERMRCAKGSSRRARICRKVAKLPAKVVILLLSQRVKDRLVGDDPHIKYVVLGSLMIILASQVMQADQCPDVKGRFPALAAACHAAVPAFQSVVSRALEDILGDDLADD